MFSVLNPRQYICTKYAWELRKLKDFTIKTGKKNSEGEDYPAYSVSNKLGLVSQTKQFDGSRLDFLDKTAYKFVNQGEFAYNPARINVGSIAFNDLGKTVIVSSLYVVLKISDKLDNEYILQFIKSIKFIEEVKRNTEGSVREYLFFDNFKNIKFPYIKNLEEQQKIGSFFKQLDNTITLHQRKLDKLKRLKQGYLQQLFPKNDEKVPRVRFTNFDKEWKLHTLGDVTERFDNLRVPITASDRISGATPYYGANGIQDYVEGHTHDGEFVLVAEDGANDFKNYPVQYVNGKVWVNNHTHVLQGRHELVDNKFLMIAIKNVNIEPFLVGGGRAKLNANIMMKLELLFPNMKEQQEIGTFFKQFDSIISFEYSKIDKLNSVKQALLQKMFI
ncbi:restriction endonuclease subunit S [Lactococcus lactis subsp. lactis]|uniref:Restriction endonuclease subunit S n=1 Tax=Lactococcus lactis subsp. lactis TaxID=1360 RepID=A0A2Z3KHW6_LACLL|nr:restriction endonuclease subunit S [Lactococcus lactis subsp. lactis]